VCRTERHRDVGHKDDFAVRLDHLVQWDAENKDDLARRGRLAAGALVDRGAWAVRDAGRWDDHQKVKDRDCQLAWVRDFRLEEDHDCQLAKDVEAERRAAQKRQPQAGQLLADPAVAGRARADAEGTERRDYPEKRDVAACRVEQAQVWVRMSVAPAAWKPVSVALRGPQAL